jgi:hypothetical protein
MEYQEEAGPGERAGDSGQEQTEKARRETAAPADEYLGIDQLPFKMTRQMMGMTAYWGQNQSSFKMAEEVMRGRLGYSISDELIRQVTEHVGQQAYERDKARAEMTDKNMAEIPYRPEAGGILYIMIDGAAGSSWRENKPAIVFDSANMRCRPGEDSVSGEARYEIMQKEYVAVVGGVVEFSKQVFDGAVRCGTGTGNTSRR